MAAGDVSGAYTQLRSFGCALFDGVDDEIVFNGLPNGMNGAQIFSLSMWIKPKKFSSVQALFTFYSATTGRNVHNLEISGAVTIDIHGSATSRRIFSTLTLLPNVWNHLLIIRSVPEGVTALDTDIDIYINGVLSTKAAIPVGAATTSAAFNNLKIGENAGNTNDLNGCISNIALYNVALTASEAASLYSGVNIQRGLVHNWKLQGNSTDSIGGITGSETGATYGIIDDALQQRLAAQYVGAKDKFMIADVGNGGILSVSIEGG